MRVNAIATYATVKVTGYKKQEKNRFSKTIMAEYTELRNELKL